MERAVFVIAIGAAIIFAVVHFVGAGVRSALSATANGKTLANGGSRAFVAVAAGRHEARPMSPAKSKSKTPCV